MAELKDLNMTLMGSQKTLAEIERDTNLFSGIGKLLAAGQVLDNVQRERHRGAVDKMTEGLKDRTRASDEQTEAINNMTEGFGGFGQKVELLSDDIALLNEGLRDLIAISRKQFEAQIKMEQKAKRRRGGAALDDLDTSGDVIPLVSPFAERINPEIAQAMRAPSPTESEELVSDTTKGVLLGVGGAALTKPIYNLTIGMGKLLLRFTGISAAVALATPVFTTLKDGVNGVINKLSTFAKTVPNRFSGAGRTAGQVGRTARTITAAGAAADLDFLGITNAQDDFELNRRKRILAKYQQLSQADIAAQKKRIADIDAIEQKTGAPKADRSKLLKRLSRFGRLLGIGAIGFAAFDAVQLARTASKLEAAEELKGAELTAAETDAIIKSVNPMYKSIYELAPGEIDPSLRGMGGVTGFDFNTNLRENLNNAANGILPSVNMQNNTSTSNVSYNAANITTSDPSDMSFAVG